MHALLPLSCLRRGGRGGEVTCRNLAHLWDSHDADLTFVTILAQRVDTILDSLSYHRIRQVTAAFHPARPKQPNRERHRSVNDKHDTLGWNCPWLKLKPSYSAHKYII